MWHGRRENLQCFDLLIILLAGCCDRFMMIERQRGVMADFAAAMRTNESTMIENSLTSCYGREGPTEGR